MRVVPLHCQKDKFVNKQNVNIASTGWPKESFDFIGSMRERNESGGM